MSALDDAPIVREIDPLCGDTTALVLENAGEAFVSTDVDGLITGWNLEAERTFGWTRLEAIGRPLVDTIVPGRFREAHLAGMGRYLQTGVPTVIDQRLELEAVDRDGRVFPVEMTIGVVDHRGVRTFTAFLHDITERRVAEESARRLAAIVQESSDAIVAADGDGRIVEFNPSAERMFGWARQDIAGRSVFELIPEHAREHARDLQRRSIAGERIVGVEAVRQRRDGTPVWVELSLSLGADGSGSLAGSAVYRDISERKRAENELAEHTSRLRALAEQDDERITRPSSEPLVADADAEPDRDRIADRLVALVRERLGMDLAWLSELTDEEMIVRAADGGYLGIQAGARVPRDQTICDAMVAGIVPQRIDDTHTLAATRDIPFVADGSVGSYVGVPVALADGQLYGTLCAISQDTEPGLDDRDLELLRVLAELLADQLGRERQERSRHRDATELTAMNALLAALDARDHYTGEHSHAVVELAKSVARQLGLDVDEVTAVGQVAFLHDLGKVGIPDSVLQKPGPLNDAEWALMREHPAIGARIVAAIPAVAHLAPVVHAEHERWDGGGYPHGLAGEQIPQAARITLACDAYHAMISDRPYRAAMTRSAALDQLREHAGSQFDPAVVSALLGVLGREA